MATYPWLCYLWGVGLNSSGDPDIDCSHWHIRQVVGLSGGEVAGPGGSQG